MVTVEESKTFGIQKEIVKGLQFDRGYISPYMITDAERMEAVYENPRVLVTDKKISSIQEILPIMEKIAQKGGKDLVIIADEVEGEALATLVINKLRGTFNTLAIKAPGFGDRRKEMLEDIAIVMGTYVISEETGKKLEKIEMGDLTKTEWGDLGEAKKIISTKENTTIIGGWGQENDEEKVQSRIKQIKVELAKTESEFDKEKLQERLAKLAGGVAVIKVGAATEVEQKGRQHKTEDALSATRAAIEEGIVPGGGVALLKCQEVLDRVKIEGEEKIGLSILKRALEEPLRKIAQNAGIDGAVAVAEVKKMSTNEGFNAQAMEYQDLVKAGIIDPTKVVRTALQNAVSAASMLLTTETVVAEKPEEKEKGPKMPSGYGEEY